MSELAFDARPRDPTGTAGHRRAFRAAGKLRVNQLRAAMRIAIMEQDVLGIGGLASGVMAYHPHEVRLRAFAAWLDVTAYQILDGPWLSQHVAKAWQTGEVSAAKQLGGIHYGESSAHILELARLELEGIVSAIVQQLSREASRIVARGRTKPAEAWRRLSQALDKVGPPRIMALANTITVMAHNRAKIAHYRNHGIHRVGIIPEILPHHHQQHDAVEDKKPGWTSWQEQRARAALWVKGQGGKFTGSRPGEAQPQEAKAHPGPGYSPSAIVDHEGVIHTSNVYDAQRALFENRRVQLKQLKQVSTLIQRLGETAAEMAEHGEKVPVFNLCNVSVEGTNLFCAEHKGIPRVKMPVIAAKKTKEFVKYLKERGYGTEKSEERADHLRATQNEIDGAKVAVSMARVDKEGFYKRLVVSRDDYILDGHHTWAAQLGVDARDGTLKGDKHVKITRVDISITDLLAEAETWTGGAGKKAAGTDALVQHFDHWLKGIMNDADRVEDIKKKAKTIRRKVRSGRNLPRKPRAKKVEQWLGEEPIEAGILTAGDFRVCDECDEYAAGAPYDIDEVEDSLPIHPNCRCTWFPWDDKRFAHDDDFFDVDPPDFIKDPTTGQFAGSHGHGKKATNTAEWVKQSEEKRQAWLKKFGKVELQPGKEQQFKNWQPSKTTEQHFNRVKEVIAKQAQVSTTYRWQMKMYKEEGDKIAKSETYLASQINANNVALTAKIGESFYREAKLKETKGTAGSATIKKLIEKAASLGYKPDAPKPQYTAGGGVEEVGPPITKPDPKVMEPEAFFGSALEVSNWEKVGGQTGSNPGGTYVDPADDSQWYVKTAQSDDHLANDLLTQRLYKLAGLNVPEQKKVYLNEMPAVASKIILNSAGDPATTLAGAATSEAAAAKKKLQEGFAVDAWLGNRDVIGLVNDNVLMDYKNGILTPARIDFGGGLKYRAQGQEKPFLAAASEINTLRDHTVNKQAAAIFGDMTNAEIAESAKKVFAISPSQIQTEASLLGIPEVGETLIARRKWIAYWVNQNAPPSQSSNLVAGVGGVQEQPPVKAKSAPAVSPQPAMATAAELEKAKKTGEFYPKPETPTGKVLVSSWNEKWATKTNLTASELVQKVHEYKETKASLAEFEGKVTAEKLAIAEKHKEAAAALQKKKEAEEAKAKAELAGIAADLGINPNDAEAVNALIGWSGGNVKKTVDEFKKFQEEGAHQGLPISPFQYALLQSYVGSAYNTVNEELRKGFWSLRTNVFANAVNAALMKLPAWTKNVKRGIGLTTSEQSEYKEGKIVLWNAFSSCGKKSAFNKNTMCEITPLQSDKTRFRDLGKLNPNEAGGEVLGMARTGLKVTKVEGKPGSKMNVWLEEVEII